MDKLLKIVPISSLHDNYIWLIHHTQLNQCVVVDPGEAMPVLSYLKRNRTQLSAILVTHQHLDHTGGLLELKECFPEVEVYASSLASTLDDIRQVREKDQLLLLNDEFRSIVYEVPGHTLGHVAYYVPSLKAVFTGDTLFSGGCGRLFEGTFQQFYASLLKLRQLPAITQMYCGHEYTVASLQFASWLEPQNLAIQTALEKANFLRSNQKPTLPSTLKTECIVNPFLRCDQTSFMEGMQQRFGLSENLTPLDLFTYLRTQKDRWSVDV